MSKEVNCGCESIDQRLSMLEMNAATRGQVESLRIRLNNIEKRAEVRNAVAAVIYLMFLVGWLLYSQGWVTFHRPVRDE